MPEYFLIRGRVQGVGMRYFIKRVADRLHIRGWVRNRSDGDVEVVCDSEGFNNLMNALDNPPLFSRIDRIEHKTIQAPLPSQFEIRF